MHALTSFRAHKRHIWSYSDRAGVSVSVELVVWGSPVPAACSTNPICARYEIVFARMGQMDARLQLGPVEAVEADTSAI